MKKIDHPLLFLITYFGIGYLLYDYGIPNGSWLILDVFLGIAFYQLVVYVFYR